MTIRVAGRYATWAAVLAIGLLLGCGDSAASDDSGEAPPECLSPGALGTCLCETMVQGTRSCQEDGTWSDCRCPPPNSTDPSNCLEGSKWMCPACPGETTGTLVECPPNHMIVCCGGGGGGDGSVTDAMVPTPVPEDAGGQDAGHDAATGSDAG